MLTFWDRNHYPLCDGINRRDFLMAGTLAVGGLTLADLLRSRAQGADIPRSGNKSVIMIYLPGGPSHIDTYDLKPDAPVEYRGEFKPIQTNVPGMQICEHFPLQATIADKFSIVRTIKFIGTHESHELITGVGIRDRNKRPAFGSVISRIRGQGGSLPPYVSLGYWTTGGGNLNDPEYPAYAGSAHWPFRPGSPSSRSGPGRDDSGLENLSLPPNMTLDRMADRRALHRSIDNLRREMDDPSGTLAGQDSFTVQALDMLTSPKARDAFDVSREPAKAREKYGPATNLLLALRLVQAGVSVVTVPLPGGSWDHHKDNFTKIRKQMPILDRGLHALLTDLHERGLDKDVAVVVWGEFGRTPRIGAATSGNSYENGRDHWPETGFALMAGCGLKTGQVVGETDARAERAKGKPYRPCHVLATLYHALGIDPGRTLPNFSGRPTVLVDDQEVIGPLT